MASSKLSDADKQIILDLYRQPEETTSTLAKRYGVSTSTISRVLKQNLPADEYSQLIQQKRNGTPAAMPPSEPEARVPESGVGARETPKSKTVVPAPAPVEAPVPVEAKAAPQPKTVLKSVATNPEEKESPTPAAPIRRRSSVQATDLEEVNVDPKMSVAPPIRSQPGRPIIKAEQATDDGSDGEHQVAITAWDDNDLDDLDDSDDLDADEADEDYGDEDDLEDEDEDEEDWHEPVASPSSPRQERLEILPFEQAAFQRTCYLVVDRLAELITCPLRDFSDLGQIPEEEEQARTLPVFDNHRIARRFSRRNQRVIKIPDASIIQKTQPYLQAKGITRLLINGQVYALP
ncbi:MAG: helix-turn-helix domain-containing protein [Cyanobacteria bacterium]|nr:helix-turn-helix domain-containing protein [Cyanobacteriota bacterium]MDA0865243.1 helix-turn-helix domain-containing protein [Cyanobacteriota bacterium]